MYPRESLSNPYASNLAISNSWLIQLKALERSVSHAHAICFLSSAFFHRSSMVINSIRHCSLFGIRISMVINEGSCT